MAHGMVFAVSRNSFMVDRARKDRSKYLLLDARRLPNPHKAIASGELLDRLNEIELWIRENGGGARLDALVSRAKRHDGSVVVFCHGGKHRSQVVAWLATDTNNGWTALSAPKLAATEARP